MLKNNYRFFVISMVVFITVVNYIDRGALAYSQAYIIKEFNLNPQSWGQVLGYFGYGYMFGALLGGALADKKGPKFVWILIGLTWSVFLMGTAYAGEFGLMFFGGSALAGLAVFRILFGFAEGPTFAVVNRTIANWAAPSERGFATSIGLVGVPLGAVVTAPVAVGLLSITSWKVMFLILGGIGLVWIVIWKKIFTDYPEDHPKVTKEELEIIRSSEGLLNNEKNIQSSARGKIPWYAFFKNPTLVLNAISYFCQAYITFLLLTWTPKYLQDNFGFELSSLWYLGIIPWIGACFTVLLGGKISDIIRMKTQSLRLARSGLAVLSYFFTAICFLLIPTMESAWAVLILMAIGNAFNYLPLSVHWAIVADTEPAKVGTFSGITHFISNIASVAAPTLTGYLVTVSGYGFTFIAAATASSIGMILMIFVKPGQVNKKKNMHQTNLTIKNG